MTPHKQPVSVTIGANVDKGLIWLRTCIDFHKHEMQSADYNMDRNQLFSWSHLEGPDCVFHIAQTNLAQGELESVISLAF